MILSLNPGMSYSVEENNVSLGQIKKKKKKNILSQKKCEKKGFVKCVFLFWFGVFVLFCFVFFCFCCCFGFNAKSPATIFPPLQPILFFSFCFVLFLFLFSKNWENYCEQVSKNLGGGKRWKAQFKSNVCNLLRLKCLFVCLFFIWPYHFAQAQIQPQ